MQSVATSHGTCPGIAFGAIALGDHGTLLLHLEGKWYYTSPAGQWSVEMTRQEFIKLFHKAPPANVPNNNWGIVPGLTDNDCCCDRNWTRAEVQQIVDGFIKNVLGDKFVMPDGRCIDTISKGRMLARRTTRWDAKITPAPMPAAVSTRGQ